MAGLHFPITADNRNFMSAIHEITAGVQDATRQIEANGGSIDRVISMIKTGVASIGIGLGFKELVSQVTNTRDQFQKLEIAFKTFLGSEDEANKLMQQMVHTAAITPFDLAGVADGAKNLLAFGVAAEDVNKTIISLGDVAASLSQPLGDIIYLYGTTISKPKMDTQDLMQMMGRGIPIAKELAKQFGVAENKVRDLISAGKVSGEAVKKAFESMTAEGSMFGGLMEAQSKSIGGQIANIQDSIDEMFNAIGKESEGVINITLEATSKIVENWQSVLLVLGNVAAAYGAQKAILALDSGFTKAATNYGYDAEIEQLRALIPAKEEEAQTALQQAVASGNLTEAKAAEITTLREEAQAQLEALAAKEAAAKAEEVTALKAAENAEEQLKDADELVQSYYERLEAVMQLGNAEEIETAISELETAESLRNEAANISNAASEEARSAAINSVAASEARETLATQINTAQTASNTAATGILTIAKEKLAAAILKVNAAMAANSIAIVTGLVLAYGYAVYKLITYQTEESKALEDASKCSAEHDAAMRKELATLEDMKNRLEKAKKGTEEWKQAKNDIISQFGGYLSNLDAEIEKTGTLTSSYNKLTEAIRISAAARAIDKFRTEHDNSDDISSGLKTLSEQLESVYLVDAQGNRRKDNKGNFIKGNISGSLKETIQQKAYEYMAGRDVEFTAKEKAYLEQVRFFDFNAGGVAGYMSGIGSKRRKQSLASRKGEEFIAESYGTTLDKIGNINTPETSEISEEDRKYWEQEVKNRKEAYENIKKVDKEGSAEALKSLNEAEAKLAEYNNYKAQTKKSSGPTLAQIAAKEENAEGKLADVLRKQLQERLRIEKDYELERWQTRIDLMENGEAKVLAQQELDNKKENTNLERRKEQDIESELQRQMDEFNARQDILAAADKKYVKKVFRDSDINQDEFDKIEARYNNLFTDLEARQQKAESDRLQEAKESMNAYLKEFGSYQEKRLAIQEEYEKKISEAQNEGERMMLTAQRNKNLSDLDYDEWVGTGAIALAFGDISKLSDKTVNQLISDMELYREKVIQTFDPEKIQKYEDALNGLKNAQSDKSFGMIASYVPDYFKERKSVGSQMESAGKNVNALEENRLELLQKIARLQDLINVIGEDGNDTRNLSDQLREVNVELSENEEALKKSKNVFQQLQEQWNQLETPQAKFEALCGAISNVSDLVGDLVSQASEMCDALGAEGLGEALGYLGDAMNSVSNIASGFANGGVIGGIAAAAGEIMGWIGKIFSAGDNRHQKNIENLQYQIDALDKSYEKLGKTLDEAFSADASHLIDQQNTLLEQQKALILQQMAEEEAKKNTDDDKIRDYKDRLDEIDETIAQNRKDAKDAIIGEDLKSAINEFASLYAEAWTNGKNVAEKTMSAVKDIVTSALSEALKSDIQPAVTAFRDKLAEAMKDGVLTDEELNELDSLKKEIDILASKSEEQYKMIQERYRDLDELKEDLTDISFDSVRDNFKSKLADMKSDASSFTDDFSDMLRNALIDGLMDTKYDNMLKEWYDEFAEKMDDRKLTDEERDALRQKYDAIVQQGIEDRDFINSIVGGGAYSQEASRGWSTALTQDQGDELNGRFTAMTELEAINNSLVSEGNMIAVQILDTLRSLSSLSMVTDGENQTLRDIRDMMFLSTGHLEDISKYTKQLITIREGIDKLNDLINQRL